MLSVPPVLLNKPPPSAPILLQLLPSIVLFVILIVAELLLKIPPPHPAAFVAILLETVLFIRVSMPLLSNRIPPPVVVACPVVLPFLMVIPINVRLVAPEDTTSSTRSISFASMIAFAVPLA
jgi:hypothetical protein